MAHVLAGANSPTFRCPAERTTLVKSVFWENRLDTGASEGQLIYYPADGNWLRMLSGDLAAKLSSYHEIWTVLHPGDGIYVYCPTGDIHVVVAGAVLYGSPEFPSAELANPVVQIAHTTRS